VLPSQTEFLAPPGSALWNSNEFGIPAKVFEDADICVGYFTDFDTSEKVIRPDDDGVISSLQIYDVLTGITTVAAVNAEHVRERLQELDEHRRAERTQELPPISVAHVNEICKYVEHLVNEIFPNVVAIHESVRVVKLDHAVPSTPVA
jgi:hypothetical protein